MSLNTGIAMPTTGGNVTAMLYAAVMLVSIGILLLRRDRRLSTIS